MIYRPLIHPWGEIPLYLCGINHTDNHEWVHTLLLTNSDYWQILLLWLMMFWEDVTPPELTAAQEVRGQQVITHNSKQDGKSCCKIERKQRINHWIKNTWSLAPRISWCNDKKLQCQEKYCSEPVPKTTCAQRRSLPKVQFSLLRRPPALQHMLNIQY